MKLIRLTTTENTAVFVNPARVVKILAATRNNTKSGARTIIYTEAASQFIMEEIAKVVALVEEALK